MQMYKDMVMKLQFHKEEIIKKFLKKGIYPSDSLISQELSNIDARLALFKAYKYQPGEKVNIKELNHDFAMMYKDLETLYVILEQLYTSEYNKLLDYIESHLDELDSTVDKYVKRAEEETNSTTLGKTIYFESNSFDITSDDNKLIVDLGTVSLHKASKIACFANVSNTEEADIKFEFFNADSEYDFKCLAYNNHGNDTAIVPGELELVKHDISINEDFNMNDDMKIVLDELNTKNEYTIMNGLNKILVKSLNTGKEVMYDFPTVESPLHIKEASHISFYLADSKKFEYNFNMKPVSTNFSLADSEVTISEDVKKIFISAQENFTCYFNINDGKVFSIKEKGVIKNNSLYYHGYNIETDMQIREYKRTTPLNYNVKTTIQSDNIEELAIDCIYIKEL